MADTTKQYFSERQGRGPKAEPLPFADFRELVINVFDHFREQHYMQESFGYDCVDAGEVDGTLGSNPSAYFMRTIRRRGVWSTPGLAPHVVAGAIQDDENIR